MPAGRRACAALVLVVATICQTSFAALPMRFDRLGSDDGLSQLSVNAIQQDATGFLWFGTEDGLDRYDGYTFQHLQHDRKDPRSLASNFVSDIEMDARGVLWVATDGGAVLSRDGARGGFDSILDVVDNTSSQGLERLRAITFDRAGNLWMASLDSGLAMYDPRSRKLLRFRHDPLNMASLGSDVLFAVLADRQGDIWVGTDVGISRISAGTYGVKRIAGTPATPTRALLEDHAGEIWAATDAGLVSVDPKSGVPHLFTHDAAVSTSLPGNGVTALFEDSHERLWIGTTEGLALLDRKQGRFDSYRHDPADAGSLPDSHIMSLFEDRSGLLWVGTKFGGIARWNPRTWLFGHHVPPVSDDAAAKRITGFAQSADSRLWVSSFGGGLAVIDRDTGARTTFGKLPQEPRRNVQDDRVMTVLASRNGNMWVGTLGEGLSSIDPGTNEVVATYQHDPENPHTLGAAGVLSLFEDSSGLLWVGTYGGGLSRFDAASGRFHRYAPDEADLTRLANGRVTAIAQDRSGRLWVGTDGGGLHVFDVAKEKFFRLRHDPRKPTSLSTDSILTLHVDARDTVWVGTQGGGLDRVMGSSLEPAGIRFVNVSQADGLPNNTVYGIRADRRGNLWLSTNHGLARLDPRSGDVRVYHRNQGLQGEEFNFGAHFATPAGELLFGGLNGYNAFFPDQLRFNSAPPPVVLTSLMKFNRPFDVGVPSDRIETLHLGHRDDFVTFEFAALDFASPRTNRYRYKLEGFDPDWIDAGARRSVTYNSLPGGSYTLRVSGANMDGSWSTNPLAIALKVDAPPWASWWARAIYVTLAGLFGWLCWVAHRRSLEHEERTTRRLEEQVELRTRELAERNRELERVNRRLEEVSLSDPLTGLGNRRSLVQAMPRLVATSSQHANRMTLMLVDLDRLKPINDEHGHEAGDQVLAQVGSILLNSLRDTDKVVRWGGDEFVIVSTGTDLDGAALLAERIRAAVAAKRFRVSSSLLVRTSCSIGFACYPFVPLTNSMTWEETLSIADMALYRAKAARNAWVGWSGTAAAANISDFTKLLEKDAGDAQRRGLLETRGCGVTYDHTIELLLRKGTLVRAH